MSQFNEPNDNPLESKDGFAQYLRTFRPRPAQVSLDEVYAEQLSEQAITPVLFPTQPMSSEAASTRSSWLRVGIAWSCGMMMGAAITALLLNRGQALVAQTNESVNKVQVSTVEPATGNENASDATETPSAEVQLTNNSSNNQLDRWDLRHSIELPEPNWLEDRPLVVSHRWLRPDSESGAVRSLSPRSIPEAKSSDQSDPLPKSTFEINFEPSQPKSQRHLLMRELLEESI